MEGGRRPAGKRPLPDVLQDGRWYDLKAALRESKKAKKRDDARGPKTRQEVQTDIDEAKHKSVHSTEGKQFAPDYVAQYGLCDAGWAGHGCVEGMRTCMFVTRSAEEKNWCPHQYCRPCMVKFWADQAARPMTRAHIQCPECRNDVVDWVDLGTWAGCLNDQGAAAP